MKHLTALSDKNYILYGMALIESLEKSTIPWTLHYYCIDESTYTYLKQLNYANVIPYPPNVLFINTFLPGSMGYQLMKHKTQQYDYFCWCLASTFTNYIISKVNCDSITYIDSDIYFHKDIRVLFDAYGSVVCGLFRHRHFTDMTQDYPDGKYNVGVVYFKNSTRGRELLNWWADSVLFKKNKQYLTCGDQKYLEFIAEVCAPHEIYIDKGIGHGAGWHWHVYDFSKLSEGRVIWNGEEQDLVFTHFSKFKYNLADRSFTCGWYKPDSVVFQNAELMKLHMDYLDTLIVCSRKIRL